MKREEMEMYKNKLLKEKKKVSSLLNNINEQIISNVEFAQELSAYDNHPGDLGEEMANKEKNIALKANEITILKKIDNALASIENESYGRCKMCGEDINKDRLQFLPYAEYCVECQSNLNEVKPREINDRCVEERVLGYPFGYGYNDFTDKVGFDAEDSYQAVARFNEIDGVDEYEVDDVVYVEPIEAISNDQYRRQLPD